MTENYHWNKVMSLTGEANDKIKSCSFIFIQLFIQQQEINWYEINYRWLDCWWKLLYWRPIESIIKGDGAEDFI